MNGPRDGCRCRFGDWGTDGDLHGIDPPRSIGRSWLSDLNKLGGRSSVLSPGQLIVPPFFEFPPPPPRDLLAWLISNPERLRKPETTPPVCERRKSVRALSNEMRLFATKRSRRHATFNQIIIESDGVWRVRQWPIALCSPLSLYFSSMGNELVAN